MTGLHFLLVLLLLPCCFPSRFLLLREWQDGIRALFRQKPVVAGILCLVLAAAFQTGATKRGWDFPLRQDATVKPFEEHWRDEGGEVEEDIPVPQVSSLHVTSFVHTPSNVWLTVEWPPDEIFPQDRLDLYAVESLDDAHWRWLGTISTALGTNVVVHGLPVSALPGFFAVGQEAHGELCVATTNVVEDLYNSNLLHTNVVWTCECIVDHAPPAVFLAFGTREDTDRDGLYDAYEQFISRTSPYLADTDGDGATDGSEFRDFSTDPEVPDTDGDGLSDYYEIHHALDPLCADTDGDGFSDGEEVLLYMTDPKHGDTDHDGLSDEEEILLGTSPFASDTDDDGLSDNKEVRELHSNPLSVDSDGDGIDDYEEYIGRDTGLDLLDPTDADDDWDGDGFSNLEEFETAHSHIVPASQYETPGGHLLKIHPLRSPMRQISSTYATILALGSASGLGAKIRVPTSTQHLLTNTVRRLTYTDAPGIWLGGRQLAGGGFVEIPDSAGTVEYLVSSSPGFGGISSSLALESETGAILGRATLIVPQMTGASLHVSNLPSPISLNPGTNAVVCTTASDALYGQPRITFNPSVNPHSANDVVKLANTDLLLASTWGATNGTFSLNYRRWDSAHQTRHGIELPPGITHVNLGIDFDIDGTLDTEEIALTCDIHVVNLHLTADTDRNGVLDGQDAERPDTWTPDNGAYLVSDNAPSLAAEWKRDPATSPLTRIRAECLETTLPEGYHVDLHAKYRSETDVHHSDYAAPLAFSTASVITGGLEYLEQESSTYCVSTYKPCDVRFPDLHQELSLRLRKGVSTIAESTVSLFPPPVIVPWNTLPLKRLYCAEFSPYRGFPAEVATGKQCRIPMPPNATAWVQDFVELAAFAQGNGWNRSSLELHHWNDGHFQSNLVASVAQNFNEVLCSQFVSNEGNGGNIEATPPLPGYPYGRLMTGANSDTHICDAVKLLERQGIQGPAICIPNQWLAVGHVDEVFCFIDERTVLVPSPRLAYDLIEHEVLAHNGNYTNTFVWGNDSHDYIHSMQSTLYSHVETNAVWRYPFSQTTGENVAENIRFSLHDRFLYEGEFFTVTHIQDVDPSGQQVHFERGRYLSSSIAHPANGFLCILSDVAILNLEMTSTNSCIRNINKAKKILRQEISDIHFVEVPVLYMEVVCSDGVSRKVAGTPNLVNAVVDGGTVYMTDPGCALFRDATLVPGKHFVSDPNAWTEYHCMMGELHCGSAAERELPPSPPWWSRREFNAWPYKHKPTPR